MSVRLLTAILIATPAIAPMSTAASSPTVAAEDGTSTEVRGWSVRLDHRATRHEGQVVRSRRSFETVGVTWTGASAPHVEVRAKSAHGWSDWHEAGELVDGKRGATEALWVDRTNAVRVRVSELPRKAELVMVDPGEDPADEPADRSAVKTRSAAATSDLTVTTAAFTTTSARAAVTRRSARHAPMPRLRWRKAWGANESLRSGDPVYLRDIKQAHVHHTAGKSAYTRSEVPAIIRSMYWYHTKQLGWSDIGYNFLVDRFGRIWVGRAGGPRGRVRGAHTLGFNHASFGVASIGNHEVAHTSKRAKRALVRLIAWKIDREGRNPAGRVRIRSQGSDLYPAGRRVRLPVVTGHRDTNQTACPGIRLYDDLPQLRRRAQRRADNWG